MERGNGRRNGWLSNLHLGALDPTGRYGEPGGFVMLGKTFKGLTDEMLRWQTQELPRHADGPTDGYVVRLHPEVALYLLEEEPKFLQTLQKLTGLDLELRDDPMIRLDDFRLMSKPAGRDVTQQYAVA